MTLEMTWRYISSLKKWFLDAKYINWLWIRISVAVFGAVTEIMPFALPKQRARAFRRRKFKDLYLISDRVMKAGVGQYEKRGESGATDANFVIIIWLINNRGMLKPREFRWHVIHGFLEISVIIIISLIEQPAFCNPSTHRIICDEKTVDSQGKL